MTDERIRSYRVRSGRMGPQLQQAWQEGLARWTFTEWAELPADTMLEIGSGMGEALLAAAPRWDLVIGIEVHVKGLAATIRGAEQAGLGNVRVVHGDAVQVLGQVGAGSLAEVRIWFPDPWPKAKHHKRRLIRPQVAALLVRALRARGVLRLATDIEDYAAQMQRVLGSTAGLVPSGDGGRVERPADRPVTRYEQSGIAAGRRVVDLAYRRVA